MKSKSAREALELRKARLLEEAAAVDRDMADLDRLAKKYNLVLRAPNSAPARAKSQSQTRKPKKKERQAANGSLAAVLRHYKSDEHSPYRSLRFRTRQNYDGLLRHIERDLGSKKISEIRSQDLLDVHQLWTERGVAMSHSLVGMLRTLCAYGSTALGDIECERLSVVLHNMRFPVAKPSTNRKLSAEQAKAIIKKAHERGLHALALAQAFQFDCRLAQRDTIGEWVPVSEPGVSVVTQGKEKWLRGIRWSEIDNNLILRHTTSKGLKDVAINLRNAPLVMAEFDRIGALPQSGPVIIFEETNLPYKAHTFREQWRSVARAVGVPDEIKNMDSPAKRTDQTSNAQENIETARG
jgi:hypothetical protein